MKISHQKHRIACGVTRSEFPLSKSPHNKLAWLVHLIHFTDTPESAHRVVTNRGALMHGASVGLCYNF